MANEGSGGRADGNVTVLLGGPGGLRVGETVTNASVPHPNSLALSDLGRLYATTAGVENAFSLPLRSGNAAGPLPIDRSTTFALPRPLELFVAPGRADL